MERSSAVGDGASRLPERASLSPPFSEGFLRFLSASSSTTRGIYLRLREVFVCHRGYLIPAYSPFSRYKEKPEERTPGRSMWFAAEPLLNSNQLRQQPSAIPDAIHWSANAV